MNPFKKIKRFLNQRQNSYIPSTADFLELDLEELAKQLQIEEKATQRGSQELPSSDSKLLDNVETEIINTIEAEKNRCYSVLLDELHAYDNRINVLNLNSKVFDVKQTIENAKSEFETESRDAINQLQHALQNVENISSERKKFKQYNKLVRTATYPQSKLLSWGFISLLFLFEVILNGNFLSIGNDNGLLGGVVEATGIAFVNISIGFLAGKFIYPLLTHVKIKYKLISFFSTLIYLSSSIIFNLLVSHYRMALAGKDPDFASFLAIKTFIQSPLYLDNFDSWIMFFMGFLFSVLASIKSFKMDDSYFGYGKLERKYKNILDEYANSNSQILQDLREIKDNAINLINQFKESFSQESSSIEAILVSRQKIINKFKQHLIYLEDSKQHLIKIYREFNISSRTTIPPDYFHQIVESDSSYVDINFDLKLKAFKEAELETPLFFKSLDALSEKMHSDFLTIQERFPLLSVLCERDSDE